MEWKAYEFHLVSGGHEFLFTPLKASFISQFVVIRYQLQMDGMQVVIPYYVSNGKTNELRANMLFPFMNFNERDKLDPSCPTSFSANLAQHGLLKYNILKNMSDRLTKNVVTRFQMTKEQFEDMNRDNPDGIQTILRRMENILDFIIGCFTPMILEYDESRLDCYMPQPVGEEYNPLSCIHKVYKPNVNEYRRHLLAELKDFSTYLFQEIGLETKLVTMHVEPETEEEFNASLNICHSPYETTVHQYRLMSDAMAKCIAARLPDYIQIKRIIPQGKELEKQIKGWLATCKTGNVLPRTFYIFHETSFIRPYPIATIKYYSIPDEDLPLDNYLEASPIDRVKKRLTTYVGMYNLAQIQEIVQYKKGLTQDLAHQIIEEIKEVQDKTKHVYLEWTHVISMCGNFELPGFPFKPSDIEFFLQTNRMPWILKFLQDLVVNSTLIIICKNTIESEMVRSLGVAPIQIVQQDTHHNFGIIHIIKDLSQMLGKKSKRNISNRKRTRTKRTRKTLKK